MIVSESRRQVGRITAIIILFVLVFFVVGVLVPSVIDISGYLQAAIDCVSILFAVLTIKQELTVTQRLEEAEFVVSLNEKFYESSACKAVFSYSIWEAHKRMLALHESGERPLDASEYERVRRIVGEGAPMLSQVDISTYLTYFESIFLLLQSKVIRWETLNELFKYRFFTGVHSDFIQSERLVRLPSNFKNLYYLERLWMEYNRNDPSAIAEYERRLEVACEREGKHDEYHRIIDEMESKYGMLKATRKESSERKSA